MNEDLHTEFKSTFNDAVIETLVAFANTKGGKVLIGIDNTGIPVNGFTIGSETLQKWINEIKNKTQPSIIPDAEVVEFKGARTAELSVKEFPIKPASFRGRYFKRVGNSNHQLSLNEISELHLRSFNLSWDSYVNPGYKLDTISLEKVSEFIIKCNKDKEIPIEDDPLTVLQKFGLTKDLGVTSACHLLFSKNDVFEAAIELGRFSTPTSIKDGLTVRSDLFNEVELVLDFIKKHINKEYIITGDPQREERWQYPLQALREIIINMIVHRDYMHSGDSSIKVYNDYIEFFNFGKLPEGISIAQLVSGHYTSSVRNKMIASTFKEAQLIEKYGSGIKRIQEGFVKHGLEKPYFEELQGGFLVTVYSKSHIHLDVVNVHEKVNDNVNENVNEKLTINQQKIVEAMQTNSKITIAELAYIIKISSRTIERNLGRLQKVKKIERIGSDKTGYWQIN